MQFRAPKDQDKILWIASDAKANDGGRVGYATWLDAGKPWAAFTLEEIKFDPDVSEYIRQRGVPEK